MRKIKYINYDSEIELDAENKNEISSIFHEIYYCVRTSSFGMNI